MTETTPGVPLGAWLAELDDERLIRLLELRPDLTQPPPGSIAALAARAQARHSYGYQQATSCQSSVATGTSGGASVSQMPARARGQRGWKAQPSSG